VPANESQTSPLLIVEDDLALQKQIKWSLDRFESVTASDRESALVQQRVLLVVLAGQHDDLHRRVDGQHLLKQLEAFGDRVGVGR
jgi:two-component system, NtrC family, response regulator